MKKIFICWIVLISFFCMMFSCTENELVPEKSRVVKIGAIYSLSGSEASTGEDIRAAIELAVEMINSNVNIDLPTARHEGFSHHNGAKIQVVFKDCHGNHAEASKLVEELVFQDKAAAIMGCYHSSVTAAASEQAEVLRIPFVNAESSSPILTQRGLKWFFRTTPDDRIFSENFFTFFSNLQERHHIRIPKKLILVYENRLWGTSVSMAERDFAYRKGYDIVGDIPYDSHSSNFETELDAIEKAMPGIILQSSYSEDAVALIKGYKQRGINPVAILGMNAGFISPSFIAQLGKNAEFLLSREVWAVDAGNNNPLVKAVNEMYKKKYGRNMTGNSARTFTGMMILADALNRAKSFKPEDIRDALRQTDIGADQLIMPWDGVRFDPKTGQNVLGRGIIVQIIKGEYRTVWPWHIANTEVIWPLPEWSEKALQ